MEGLSAQQPRRFKALVLPGSTTGPGSFLLVEGPPTSVPEPTTLAFLGAGLIDLAAIRRR
jgi:PEP-CTERM motif